MAKTKLYIILGIMVFLFSIISGISSVNAQTPVIGKIYDSSFNNIISGADVVVICNGNSLNTTSLEDGAYAVRFNVDLCSDPSNVKVEASKGDMSGSGTGELGPCDGSSCEVGDYFSVVNVGIKAPETTTTTTSSGGGGGGGYRGYFNCGNNKCDTGENSKTCPKDCSIPSVPEATNDVAPLNDNQPVNEIVDNTEDKKSGGITGAFGSLADGARNPWVLGVIVLVIAGIVIIVYRGRKSVSSY